MMNVVEMVRWLLVGLLSVIVLGLAVFGVHTFMDHDQYLRNAHSTCPDGILISQKPWYLQGGAADRSHQCYVPMITEENQQKTAERAHSTGQ